MLKARRGLVWVAGAIALATFSPGAAAGAEGKLRVDTAFDCSPDYGWPLPRSDRDCHFSGGFVALIGVRSYCNPLNRVCPDIRYPYRFCVRPPDPGKPSQRKICWDGTVEVILSDDVEGIDVTEEVPGGLRYDRGIWRGTWKHEGRVVGRAKTRLKLFR